MKGIKGFRKERKVQFDFLKDTKNKNKSKDTDSQLKNINKSSKLKDIKENPRPSETKEESKIPKGLKTNERLKISDILKDEELLVENEETGENKTNEEQKSEETIKEKETTEATSALEDDVNARIEKKKELYKTLYEKEYEYADVLVKMLNSLRKPLIDETKSENPTITSSQIETLFDGFDDILNLSWSLCGELKMVYNLYKQLKPVNIGNVFLNRADEFDAYFKYSTRYSTANEVLRDLNSNIRFRKYQYELLKSTPLLQGDDYREVLRLPIYHVHRYNTILKELLNNTPKYDPSYEMLEDSYDYINELYLELKESLKKERKVDEILEIRKNIVDCPRSIVKPGRYLYRDFSNLIELPSQKPFRVIIFSDILLLAKWDRKQRRFVFSRMINYKALKVIDNVSKTDSTLFSLLLLNPFSKKNFDIPQANNNRFAPGNNVSPIKGANQQRGDSFSRAFSRLFSWSFNQNITRIDLKAPSEEVQQQIVEIINKRISELHPPPFELLWPDPNDIYDVDVVKGIRNPVPADQKEIILDSYICNHLYRSFPKRLRIKRSLTLLYSLQNHGSSLNTFYERSNAGYGTAQVLVIKDSNDNIFGCFTAEPFKMHNGFYGTGESFLFKVKKPNTPSNVGRRKNFGINRITNTNTINTTITPSIPTTSAATREVGAIRNRFRTKKIKEVTTPSTSNDNNEEPKHGDVKVFPWAKTNYLFINSTNEYVAVGSGQGKFGIWCDNQFQNGQSYPTETYHNECLSGSESFNIVNVELWTFTSQIEREFRKKRQSRFPTKFQKK
ncbi:TLD-domain-containing protein [Anaeromyces robustus]|jgi:hypothetical protein|uniref:Oxidation resistance protein 1 n=1 Tax=Anaeromyces robustus TaxID=1754192 RepID=A0A1Y1WSW8_9FUNG|nr:TLD-domain-containing protein [Anaeromyces robustus]|eukprot:ORX76640.1 TLD-domain-containing protein [Anaeromyces robustus]